MKTLQELQPLIINWAKERDLIHKENAPKQKLKLIEEAGELARAILKNNVALQKDSIGDIFVVLVILSKQIGIDLDFELDLAENDNDMFYNITTLIDYSNDIRFFNESLSWLNDISLELNLDLIECANIAYNEIKDRKGETINGTFIKI